MRDRNYCLPQQPRGAAEPDYKAEFERRVEQFHANLSRGHERALKIAEGPCFMIFVEAKGSTGDDHRELAESKKSATESVMVGSADSGPLVSSLDDAVIPPSLPDEARQQDNSQCRFVQFSFEEKWFCLDMPLQTLSPAEATKTLRSRRGFFYLVDRPEFTLYGEDVDGYDPFRKIYWYGDERDAAADMAFIFFNVWEIPVDSRLHVRSAAFGKNFSWEQDVPLA